MKKMFTLAAASVLAAGTLSAQAQVALDGVLTAPELTTGNYVLLGKFTNPRGFGNAGLLSLYAASTSTKLYIFVGGTVEPNGNAFQLFLDFPGAAGVASGTALPNGTTGTSFQNVAFKLDMEADAALALRSDTAPNYKVEGVTYVGTSGASTTSKNLTSSAVPLVDAAAPITLSATNTVGAGFELFNGTRMAYKTTAPTGVAANPGNTTPNTGASYGGVGTEGWEIEIDRASAGIAGGTPNVTMFVVQNGGDGGYASSDFIPQTSVPLTTNSGNLASGAFDFTTLPDRQAATVTLRANGAALGTHSAAAAAMGLTVAPNPVAGRATINYTVATGSEQVRIALTDLMGREVRVLENGTKAAGAQTLDLNAANLAAGTYLVKVQQGDRTATRKVVLL